MISMEKRIISHCKFYYGRLSLLPFRKLQMPGTFLAKRSLFASKAHALKEYSSRRHREFYKRTHDVWRVIEAHMLPRLICDTTTMKPQNLWKEQQVFISKTMVFFEREKKRVASCSVQIHWLRANEFVFPRVVRLFVEAQKNKSQNTTSLCKKMTIK